MSEYDIDSMKYLEFMRKKYSLDENATGEMLQGLFEYINSNGVSTVVKFSSVKPNTNRKSNTKCVTASELHESYKGRKNVSIDEMINKFPSLNLKNKGSDKFIHMRLAYLKRCKKAKNIGKRIYDFSE